MSWHHLHNHCRGRELVTQRKKIQNGKTLKQEIQAATDLKFSEISPY